MCSPYEKDGYITPFCVPLTFNTKISITSFAKPVCGLDHNMHIKRIAALTISVPFLISNESVTESSTQSVELGESQTCRGWTALNTVKPRDVVNNLMDNEVLGSSV